jgi:uncharacterized damage-inducible protein DinB
MDPEYFKTLFAHHYWARDRILDQVAQISQDQYLAAPYRDYPSIRATLIHNLSSEAGYLARWLGETRESMSEETLPTVEALRARWAEQQAKMNAFLAQLTEAGASKEIRLVARDGSETVNPLWALIAQALNHNTQHRAEVAFAVTQFGHSPGDLDVSRFLRERK